MVYECHITIDLYPISAKELIEALGWKFSKIAGDPQLGDKTFEYATRSASSQTQLVVVVNELERVSGILSKQGFPVVREKIELVVHDNRK